MDIIVGGRGSGKTHQIIEWWKEDPRRYIVVDSEQRGRYLQELGVDRKQIVLAYGTGPARGLVGRQGEVGFDVDLEYWFTRTFGIDGHWLKLGPVTINGAAKDGQGKIITPEQSNPYLPR